MERFLTEAGIGEGINTPGVITFQGSSVKELKKAFEDSVDDYLDFCGSRGEDPEKPVSGKTLVSRAARSTQPNYHGSPTRGQEPERICLDKLQPRAGNPTFIP